MNLQQNAKMLVILVKNYLVYNLSSYIWLAEWHKNDPDVHGKQLHTVEKSIKQNIHIRHQLICQLIQQLNIN